ncbi:MAG TPA: alanine--tRNA ligase [Candidatus Saccharimonadales bacterium]|nr:alanine--tRNA ligase [Candidatus Saccharimonadales bacterium]
MNAQDIRAAYVDFFAKRGHEVIPRALLVPQNDPTTLFTGSGMQPLIPYLLGEEHPEGVRLVDSQTCLRAQDIEEVGDNRHTTFFEMLGNWSLGDYFKKEQIPWFWEFLTKEIKLDPQRIFVTCFIGDQAAGVPRDDESAEIWTKLFTQAGVGAKQVDINTEENGARVGDQGGRIFFYGSKKNWWSRAGTPQEMPVGEPGGPTTEMFYLFPEITHNQEYGEKCHVNCDCGRYIELGNSVFMAYIKTDKGVQPLPKQNVDYGGGLERIAAAAISSPDVFKISLLWPIVEKLEQLSGKKYDSHTNAMRVIADHLRGATFLAVDGVVPSNKEQGYVLRRLVRRAMVKAFDLGIEQNFVESVVPIIADLYHDDFPEVAKKRNEVVNVLTKEEMAFRQTIRSGRRMLAKQHQAGLELTGIDLFRLYDTYGFPKELALEEADLLGMKIHSIENLEQVFEQKMQEQRHRSQTAAKGTFKGGLADHSEITTKYHTATHLMYRALVNVLGDHVMQRGSNITAERLRFDFSHPEKVTPEQLKKVENIVNEQINKDWPVSWREEKTKEVLGKVLGAMGDRYGDVVKIYTVGDPDGGNYSREICGGPHVEHTGTLAEGGKRFKIVKEEASSAGVRRIKAVLV